MSMRAGGSSDNEQKEQDRSKYRNKDEVIDINSKSTASSVDYENTQIETEQPTDGSFVLEDEDEEVYV